MVEDIASGIVLFGGLEVNWQTMLQDLPRIVDDVQDLHPRIESMAQDMFSKVINHPRPLQKSIIFSRSFRSASLISPLHNLLDTLAAQILTHIAAAMTPGYSNLVLGVFTMSNRRTVLSLWD